MHFDVFLAYIRLLKYIYKRNTHLVSVVYKKGIVINYIQNNFKL